MKVLFAHESIKIKGSTWIRSILFQGGDLGTSKGYVTPFPRNKLTHAHTQHTQAPPKSAKNIL